MATKKSDRLMAPTTICADGLRLSVRRCGYQVAAPLCDLLDAVKAQLLVALGPTFRCAFCLVLTHHIGHVLFVIEPPVSSNPQFLQRTV